MRGAKGDERMEGKEKGKVERQFDKRKQIEMSEGKSEVR